MTKIISLRSKNSNYPKSIEYSREDRPSKSKAALNYPYSKPNHKQIATKVLFRRKIAKKMTL